jgi:type I restriction enzyme S subunit
MLNFEDMSAAEAGGKVEWKELWEIGEFIRGNGLQKTDFVENWFPCIHYGQIYTYYGTYTSKTKSFVSNELAKRLKKAETGDVIITNTSENLEDVGKAVVWCGEGEVVTGWHATIFKSRNILGKYFAYYTQTKAFFIEKRKYAKGTKVIDVSATDMRKIKIPIPYKNWKPDLEKQQEIIVILDKFDALVNDISIGLPAELQARRQQYEYYREKLLTFKPLAK